MKRPDQTESSGGDCEKAGTRSLAISMGIANPGNVTEFLGLGKILRFVVGHRSSAVRRSLRTVFYRPGSIPLAGDHFCHG